jgi:hypothetical protein
MYSNRKLLYEELERKTGSNVLLYATSDRRGFEAQIGQDVIDLFIHHLDKIGVVKNLSLILYTKGGDTAAAWNIVNLIRQYCENFQVIIPHKAHSAGTLISIGANSIVMSRQATLGPIDPSINTPLNPPIPNAPPGTTFPVSVEAVKGYMQFAKEELGINDSHSLSDILIKLSDTVHPLVLGQVYRSRAQMQMLAKKLLKNQIEDAEKVKRIIDFLTSESGSHDYTINRKEAKHDLGLNIIEPDETIDNIIKAIYEDMSTELELNIPFDPNVVMNASGGKYEVVRGLVESSQAGSHRYISRGMFTVIPGPNNMQQLSDARSFEGWQYSEG